MTDEKQIPREQLDDIIGEAARQKQKAEDSLTVDEIKEVAAELDIDDEFVDAAVNELKHRQERAEKRRKQAEARRKSMLKIGGATTATIAVIFGIMFAISYGRLNSRLAAVEQKRAQVQNVVERQDKTEDMYEGQPSSIERNAALEGAENRVRIEIKRYDEVAATYNSSARGFPGNLVVALAGMPDEVPLSDDIGDW